MLKSKTTIIKTNWERNSENLGKSAGSLWGQHEWNEGKRNMRGKLLTSQPCEEGKGQWGAVQGRKEAGRGMAT